MGKIGGAIGKIVMYIVVAFLIGALIAWIGSTMTTSCNIEDTEDLIFDGINKERLSRNLPALSEDSSLVYISDLWSSNLASMNEVTHGNFDGRLQSIGLPDTEYSCGEIIGSFKSGSVNGIPTTDNPSELAKEFVDMWLDSPPHREIMLTASNGYMGVGLCRNGTTFYGVVDFKFGGSGASGSSPIPMPTNKQILVTIQPQPKQSTGPSDYSWTEYNFSLVQGTQYSLLVTGNNGYSFDSYRYLTSTHQSSTEIFETQSSLTVSGDIMNLNVYFVPTGQSNKGGTAIITINPTTNIQLIVNVRDGTSTLNP